MDAAFFVFSLLGVSVNITNRKDFKEKNIDV